MPALDSTYLDYRETKLGRIKDRPKGATPYRYVAKLEL
jgi:hypothetical protein